VAPVLLAQHFDEFAKENLTVELVEFPDVDALYGALGEGTIDAVASELDAPFYDLVNDGSGVRLVLGGPIARAANDLTVGQPGFWIRSDQVTGGEKYKDLEGDHFAVEDGIADVAAAPITSVLRQDDMSLNEARLDAVGGRDAARMLLDGQVTAAWLDEPAWQMVQDPGRFRLVATLPASESLDGVVVSKRLVDHDGDRAVGLAFVRALVRTINTYLADDYQKDDDVVAALAKAVNVRVADIRSTPPWLFDWELRSAGTERMQTAFILLGAVLYEDEIAEREIVDRTLYRDAVAQLQA
jgi:NitT/TauT family transport system substrate-binding protein